MIVEEDAIPASAAPGEATMNDGEITAILEKSKTRIVRLSFRFKFWEKYEECPKACVYRWNTPKSVEIGPGCELHSSAAYT